MRQTLRERKKKDAVKMHWSSEWAEQHYDISSTTSPPAHPKPLSYPQSSHPAFSGYSDDISALSASTLLKRYAERYSFSSVYPDPATFRRNEHSQDAWSVGYSAEGVDGIKGTLASTNSLSEQISTGAISQDFTSSYSGPHYPRPTYLPQPAFALPPTYPAPAPVYSYPPSLSTPTSPSLLPSGLHPPLNSGLPSNHAAQSLKRSEDFQEAPNHRTFAFDQSKSTKMPPYTVRDSGDLPASSGMNNESADLQNFRPDRLLPQPDLKVDLVRKGSYLHPLENPSYGGPEQFTYP